MPSMLVDNCCCCIELKTGCFIIGYLNLVATIIFTILCALGLLAGGVIMNAGETNEDQEFGLFVTITSAVYLIIFLLLLIFVIVLLVGLHKNKPGHVKVYLIYTVIFLVLYTIGFVAGLVNGTLTGSKIGKELINILANIYYLLVIRSMYYRMKDPSRGPAIYTA